MYDLSGLGIGDKADSINITLKGKEGKDAEYNFDLFICRILSNYRKMFKGVQYLSLLFQN